MKMLQALILAVSLSAAAVPATACNAVDNKAIVEYNILDKLIALVKDHTKSVESAGSIEEQEGLFAALETALAEFAEKNAAEIAAFDAKITQEQKDDYKAQLDATVKQFQKALEKRAMQLSGE
jgi:hypothetical protein